MRKFVVAACLSAIMFCNGCGDPKADGSSDEAFKKSLAEMEKGMDSAKKEKLQSAVGTLMMNKVLFNSGSVEGMKTHLKETFDGKTADEIIAAGETSKAENQAAIKKMIDEK